MDRKGIAICGTVLVDKINEISAYPEIGQLTKIHGTQKAVGGCIPNVGIDLKKICPELEVRAIGKLGDDDDGKFIRSVLEDGGLDTTALMTDKSTPTSFTEVMSIPGGQRTFFTFAGADATLTADDIDFDAIPSKILHLGYFLLLKKIDEGEGEKILKKAVEKGIETSIDLVSENSDRYKLIIPCLKYVDYLIINELEAGKLTDIEPKPENLKKISEKLMELGVRKKVIIHMKECAVSLSAEGFSAVGSVDVPKSYIKGTTGAGDAFCAGALFGIYNGYSDKEILDFASQTAVMALGGADATSGLKSEAETKEFCKQYRRMEVCLQI